MKYAFLLIMMMLLLSGHITAQTDCDLVPCVDVDVSWEDFNYDTGMDCNTSPNCNDNENSQLYQLAVAIELSSACGADDLFCRNEAFFRTITAPIYDNTLVTTIYQRPPGDLAEVWVAFSHKDYEQALTLLSAKGYSLYSLYLRGLIYELLDQPDQALNEYTTILQQFDEHQLLTIYTRGLLYGRIDRTIEASFASAWLEDYLTAYAPDLLPLVAPLTARYPLDQTRITYWTMYRVSSEVSTPGPNAYTDLTQTEPILVQLSWYDELDVVLAVGLTQLRYSEDTGDIIDTYVLQEIENEVYFYEYGIEVWDIRLAFSDELLWGRETVHGGESSHDQLFILTPSDQITDPRSGFGEPACEGGVISRLRPGMPIHEMSWGIPGLYYVENPGDELDYSLEHFFDNGFRGDQEHESLPAPITIRVTDKNLCIGDELWWEVTDGQGNYGWRAENKGKEYQLNPFHRLFYCPNAPQTRLFSEVEGRVLPGLGANHLRVEPGVESALVGTMAEGDTFTVLQGPMCADNMAWWQVQYGDLTGWTAEGQGDTYWLEPIMPWE